MKKLFLLVLLISSLHFMSAQDVSVSEVAPTEKNVPELTYCELVGTAKIFSSKINVVIDYGQEQEFFQFIKDKIVDEKTGKPKVFNSMIDALNFMGEKGWEFVQAYIIRDNNTSVFHWLLKRKLTDEEKENYVPSTKRGLK